jgi:hypothetical protein
MARTILRIWPCIWGSFIVSGCSASSSQDAGTSGGDAAGSSSGVDATASDAEPADALVAVDAKTDASLPPIDPGLEAQQLTLAQEKELCDWSNAELGGYGASTDCGGTGVTLTNFAHQAACLAMQFTSSCQMTVGQFEACILYQAPSHGCSIDFNLCRPVRTCYQTDQ